MFIILNAYTPKCWKVIFIIYLNNLIVENKTTTITKKKNKQKK